MFLFVFIYLKDRETGEGTSSEKWGRERYLPFLVHFLNTCSNRSLGEAEARNQEPPADLSPEWQEFKYLNHHLLPPRCLSWKLDLKTEARLNPRSFNTPCQSYESPSTAVPQHLLPSLSFNSIHRFFFKNSHIFNEHILKECF